MARAETWVNGDAATDPHSVGDRSAHPLGALGRRIAALLQDCCQFLDHQLGLHGCRYIRRRAGRGDVVRRGERTPLRATAFRPLCCWRTSAPPTH